ncbi:hypothetical protein C8J56DRAFT_1002681 [Mycena floridula]|nr:hypothetical protein C8J56DRAFT_1002681 [Mycena floridula]
MTRRNCRRKASWLAFGLVALAALSATAQDSAKNQVAEPPPNGQEHNAVSDKILVSFLQSSSSVRAYRQAAHTLTALTAHLPAQPHESFMTVHNTNTKSLLATFLPSLQGRGGPIGSVIRILVKVHHQIFTGFSILSRDGLGLGSGSKRKEDELHRKAIKVVDLLQHSAELGHADAIYTLAQISLFPPTIYFPSDPKLAYECLQAHAAMTGNASSQALLGFFYATGYRDIVPVNQAKAQLYYTFAANGGDKGAQMTLGYRYWSGIGTLEDCQSASEWYHRASEQAMKRFLSGPPGGLTLPQSATRLSDLVGGIYGPGASVASTGVNAHRAAIKAGISRASGETWEDILDYYLFNADRQETDFAYRLGKIYYQGSIYPSPGGIASGSEGVGAVPRDFERALHYFTQIARQVWPRDPANPLQYKAQAPIKDDSIPTGYAAASAAYLGRMYLRGEGVKADPAIAYMWFERGVEYGDRECHNGLGIIWRDGLIPGVKADEKKAVIHFSAAAGQELAEALLNIGKLHYEHGEISHATTHFDAAIRLGSPFEAYYYLAEMQSAQASSADLSSNIVSGSCAIAVSLYKIVAERGVWGDDLLKDAEYAWMSGTDRGKETAMLKWWLAAERGSEIAQNNLAYVLDQDKSILRLTRFSPMTPSNDTARLALTQWIRAAGQRNIDALVKVGDYYYHGLGVSEETPSLRLEKAAKYYQSAADTQMSALAMWNLGWMYENGVGVPQDFHLAKRHYDLALETNTEAYLPVLLSLLKLYMRSFWHTLLGGKGGLNIWDLEEDETVLQQPHDVLELDEVKQGSENAEQDRMYFEDEDGPWYMGKAKDDFRRRKVGGQAGQGEEDPIQWARERRNAEQDRDSDFGPEDYFEGALRGGNRGEEGDEFSETMLLVVLCLAVSILIYVRTRIVDRIRRNQQQGQGEHQQAPPEDNGLFPPAGDPARNEWAILR